MAQTSFYFPCPTCRFPISPLTTHFALDETRKVYSVACPNRLLKPNPNAGEGRAERIFLPCGWSGEVSPT